jgi:hypothetical protein
MFKKMKRVFCDKRCRISAPTVSKQDRGNSVQEKTVQLLKLHLRWSSHYNTKICKDGTGRTNNEIMLYIVIISVFPAQYTPTHTTHKGSRKKNVHYRYKIVPKLKRTMQNQRVTSALRDLFLPSEKTTCSCESNIVLGGGMVAAIPLLLHHC